MGTPRAPTRDLFGLLLFDKPAGLSSNGALQRVKRLYAAAKAGHGGSLDPLATGMLPIFLGPATRLAGYLLDAHKVYRVTAKLGVGTTTGDAEGAITQDLSDAPPPTGALLTATLERFVGPIEQIPPMYSALKRDGVPLYRLARAGIEVAREPRRVVIEALTLEDYRWPALTLTVRCSKGTYIRTLIEDVAAALGTVGHVTALRRLAVDPFGAATMRTWADLEAAAAGGPAALEGLLLAPQEALAGWPSATLAEPDIVRLTQGQSLPAEAGWARGLVRVHSESGRFVAIATVTADDRLAPKCVFVR